MLNLICRKTKFFLTVSILGVCVSQNTFAETMTCSLDIFMNDPYHKKYNGPCNVFINNKYAYGDEKIFDLTPRGIEKSLELRNPQFKYQDLAAFGHIGRTDIELPWEKLDKVEEIKSYL